MSNSAIIKIDGTPLCVHTRWYGTFADVEGFARYARLRNFGTPEVDPSGITSLIQVMANCVGSGFGVEVMPYDEENLPETDNGTFVLEGWEVVDIQGNRGSEHAMDEDMVERLVRIDGSQPEHLQMGAGFIRDISSRGATFAGELAVGDVIWDRGEGAAPVRATIIGFGDSGYPYVHVDADPSGIGGKPQSPDHYAREHFGYFLGNTAWYARIPELSHPQTTPDKRAEGMPTVPATPSATGEGDALPFDEAPTWFDSVGVDIAEMVTPVFDDTEDGSYAEDIVVDEEDILVSVIDEAEEEIVIPEPVRFILDEGGEPEAPSDADVAGAEPPSDIKPEEGKGDIPVDGETPLTEAPVTPDDATLPMGNDGGDVTEPMGSTIESDGVLTAPIAMEVPDGIPTIPFATATGALQFDMDQLSVEETGMMDSVAGLVSDMGTEGPQVDMGSLMVSGDLESTGTIPTVGVPMSDAPMTDTGRSIIIPLEPGEIAPDLSDAETAKNPLPYPNVMDAEFIPFDQSGLAK